jgi:hypothetical protein
VGRVGSSASLLLLLSEIKLQFKKITKKLFLNIPASYHKLQNELSSASQE